MDRRHATDGSGEALMKCPRCQHENAAGQKFCGECGARLTNLCPVCGTDFSPGQKFCGECGGRLDAAEEALRRNVSRVQTPRHLAERILISQGAIEGERKQVTVLFADIKGSLELIESSDPEHAHALLDTAIQEMMDAVHRYEGTVNKVLGDGIMALFGAPIALEDHAVRACYAALAMQSAVARAGQQARSRFGVEPQIRVGINSGEVVVRGIRNDLSMDYDAIGPTTHLAGRMEQLATPGTIRLTQATLRLAEGFVKVAPLGPVPVKGLEQPIEVYELTGATATRSRFQAAVARGLSRFVGRDMEIVALGRTFDRAAAGQGQVFAVLGEAGVGKSRLFYEFTRSHRTERALVIESRSVSYGKATAYVPVIGLLKDYFGIEESDDGRRMREKVTGKLMTLDKDLVPALAPLLALFDIAPEDASWDFLDPLQRRRRTLDAIKAVFIRESRVQPFVVVFEDLHWVDDETQALLDDLVESLPTAPVLLLVNYRPEYAHSWGGKSYYTQRRIGALPPESTTELLDGLLGMDPDLTPLKRMLIARTEGNPFFVEESVRSLAESGVLTGSPGAYRATKQLASIEVPATVQGVLVARIDRLAAEEKQLLQTAAVIGKDVPLNLLQAIAALPDDALQTNIAALRAGEFLYETRLFPDHEYTFKHALTHEVAYGSVLTERRRTLHRGIVDAIERLHPERAAEHVERLAHHAVRGELWDRAAPLLRQSGEKAVARSAYKEAVGYFEQALSALDHLPQTTEIRREAIDLLFTNRSPLQALGDHEQVFRQLRDAESRASALGDQDRLGWASAYLSQYLWWKGQTTEAESQAQRALKIGEALDDLALRVVSNFFLGQGHFNLGDYPSAIHYCRENLTLLTEEHAAKRLGLTGLPSVLSRVWLAWALAEQGQFTEASEHAAQALEIAEAVDQPYSIAAACLGIGQVQYAQGHLAGAIDRLQRARALCEASDLRLISPMTAALLGLAYAHAGRFEEALSLLERSETEAPAIKIFDTSVSWSALGTGYLLAGRLDAADESAARGVDMASRQGFRGGEAQALLLAASIAVQREPADAARALDCSRRAQALAEELGMRPLMAHLQLCLSRLHRRLGELPAATEYAADAEAAYRELGMDFWVQQAAAERTATGAGA